MCLFLPKVVFEAEGSLRGFYGADFLVAVDNVVFLPDECKERPSRCESLQRIKTRHCSQRILLKNKVSICIAV